MFHSGPFQGMINNLSLDDREDVLFIGAVADSVFSDGITNWGRVASLAAFGAAVCQYFKEKGKNNCVELVGDELSSYLLTDKTEWLLKHNSWVS